MQEWCSCGGSVKGRRRDVIAWRTQHNCVTKPDSEPEPQGTTSQVEHAGSRYYETSSMLHDVPVIQARIGFTPNA